MHDLIWQCASHTLVLNRPLVMGILNVTPDSFSDGGQHATTEAAMAQAHAMLEAGVDIIDIGGESSRPNAEPVSACTELSRIMPVLKALRDCGKPISVDTQKPYVMRAVLDAGASIINDVCGFDNPVAIDAVADSDCGLCIMHMQGEPQTMQNAPIYQNAPAEVTDFLQRQVNRLQSAGIDKQRLCIDPGIGFGKTLAHNIQILQQLPHLPATPILVGLSRKRIIGDLTRKPVHERMAGSVAGALYAVAQGAHIVRVHDVAATVDALKVWHSLSTTQHIGQS
ncbi:MAG: dihydropteroate synthase [Formosimonas sp.]